MTLRTDPDRVDEILDGLEQFVDSTLIPLEIKHEEIFTDQRRLFSEDGSFSPEARQVKQEARLKAAQAGFFTMCVPTELEGGGGQGALLHFLAWERLYNKYGPVRSLPYESIAHWARGPSHIFCEVSETLRHSIVPRILSGEQTICFSLSEPDAGSDSWNLRTTAKPVGDGWVLNGTKQWSTNGPTADYALVFAVTDRDQVQQRKGGVTAFLVPADSPGYRVDSVIRLFGSIGGDEAIISLTDVTVPSENMVGELNRGFDLALSGISLGRMFNAGRGVGLARWALEQATRYATERKTFGSAIAEYQGVQFLLADSAQLIYASRTMALDCARRIEAGESVRKELAMVKVFTTESTFKALDNCMQVFGGMGLTNELGLYEGWQQARISRIADGSGEIMRRTIARRLLQGDTEF